MAFLSSFFSFVYTVAIAILLVAADLEGSLGRSWTRGASSTGPTCGRRSSYPRVVIHGGQNVSDSRRWPWMVSLQWANGHHFCGGTLIDKNWVLTAAHCVQGATKNPTLTKVILGSVDLSRNESTRIIRHALAVFMADGFSYTRQPFHIVNDLALIRLNRAVAFSDHVQPACLSKINPLSQTKCFAIGWGRKEAGGKTGGLLQEFTTNVFPLNNCKTVFKNKSQMILGGNFLCSYDANRGARICAGDSGGPLVCHSGAAGGGRWSVAGVASWKAGPCAFNESPFFFADVSKFVGWIKLTQVNFVNHMYEKLSAIENKVEFLEAQYSSKMESLRRKVPTLTKKFAPGYCFVQLEGLGWDDPGFDKKKSVLMTVNGNVINATEAAYGGNPNVNPPEIRGVHLAVLGISHGFCQVEFSAMYDTYCCQHHSSLLYHKMASVAPGKLIIGATMDEYTENLKPSAIATFKGFGISVKTSRSDWYRGSFAFVVHPGNNKLNHARQLMQGLGPARLTYDLMDDWKTLHPNYTKKYYSIHKGKRFVGHKYRQIEGSVTDFKNEVKCTDECTKDASCKMANLLSTVSGLIRCELYDNRRIYPDTSVEDDELCTMYEVIHIGL